MCVCVCVFGCIKKPEASLICQNKQQQQQRGQNHTSLTDRHCGKVGIYFSVQESTASKNKPHNHISCSSLTPAPDSTWKHTCDFHYVTCQRWNRTNAVWLSLLTWCARWFIRQNHLETRHCKLLAKCFLFSSIAIDHNVNQSGQQQENDSTRGASCWIKHFLKPAEPLNKLSGSDITDAKGATLTSRGAAIFVFSCFTGDIFYSSRK